jgi:hypothetical protein
MAGCSTRSRRNDDIEARSAMTKERLQAVRRTIFGVALAQALYWIAAIAFIDLGLLPLDFIFLYMVLPALILSALGEAIPLGAGLTAGAFILNVGLLALLGAA